MMLRVGIISLGSSYAEVQAPPWRLRLAAQQSGSLGPCANRGEGSQGVAEYVPGTCCPHAGNCGCARQLNRQAGFYGSNFVAGGGRKVPAFCRLRGADGPGASCSHRSSSKSTTRPNTSFTSPER